MKLGSSTKQTNNQTNARLSISICIYNTNVLSVTLQYPIHPSPLPVNILIAISVIVFTAIFIKTTLRDSTRVPVDMTGFYRCIVIPSATALLLQLLYSWGILPVFQRDSSSRNSSKLAILLVLHPILSELVMTVLRWFVFHVKFAEAPSLIVLLLPGKIV